MIRDEDKHYMLPREAPLRTCRVCGSQIGLVTESIPGRKPKIVVVDLSTIRNIDGVEYAKLHLPLCEHASERRNAERARRASMTGPGGYLDRNMRPFGG